MKIVVSLVLLLLSLVCFSQLQTPEQFLGYKIGTRFTPHHRIIDYVESVAAARPSAIKLQPYGTTNEGRPLLVAYISSEANIANLASIRTANMNMANTGNTAGTNQPVIVWLSYNVHGNEPSSSEAALLTLYALANPANTQMQQYLQNTVVVIDPCINPDGRDRYVNWYNSVVSSTPNPSPLAREHNEPWPRGRANHYNFDLNRDWAWQTQIESRQRLVLYNQWLPQIHVDFHEQGPNEPYYFAPAAEPLHEVITQWQRDFQNTIGRNHAKYFDQNGWLYFTKERFDLLYPSYGDTYPIYNGAIGMTYEQGGIGAGLSMVVENGDTLTLVDRAQHHFTTSLSTIEVASKNATKLKDEFAGYFKNALVGVGDYKAYVLKPGKNDSARLRSLLQLLDRNRIHYYTGLASSTKGYNYHTNREESFSVSNADIVIPSAQPKSNLVKVLLEPVTKLTDSATYDITAWSLPYVYDIQTYGVRSAVPLNKTVAPSISSDKILNTALPAEPYAYIIPWNAVQSVKLVTNLMQKGIKLRFATVPFESGGKTFERGSVLVLKTSNQYVPQLWQTVRTSANEADVRLTAVNSGFVEKGLDFGSSSVLPLKARKVAVFSGDGISSLAAGEVWHYFDQVINYPVTLVNVGDAARIAWSDYDVVVMPDGAYRFLTDKPAAEAFRNWISGGGHVVALEGAVAQLSKLEWSLKARKGEEEPKETSDYINRYEDRERDALRGTTPGSIFRVELDNTHPLAFGYPKYYYTLKQDASIYEFIKEDGWNVGVLRKDKPLTGFVGTNLSKRLQNGLLFGVQDIGRGTVTYLADDVLFRSFWETGKLLFGNAVFLVGQ